MKTTQQTTSVEVITKPATEPKMLAGVPLATFAVSDGELQMFTIPTAEAIKKRVANCRTAVRAMFARMLETASLHFDKNGADGAFYVDLGAMLRILPHVSAGLEGINFFQLLQQAMKEANTQNRGDVFCLQVEANEEAQRIGIKVELSPRFRMLCDAGKVKAAAYIAEHKKSMAAAKQTTV